MLVSRLSFWNFCAGRSLNPMYLQVEQVEHIFEAHTVQRMELLVLSTLEWRMSSVTPFSYIDYFFHKLGICNVLLRALLSRVSEIILGTVNSEFYPFLGFISISITVSDFTLSKRAVSKLGFNWIYSTD